LIQVRRKRRARRNNKKTTSNTSSTAITATMSLAVGASKCPGVFPPFQGKSEFRLLSAVMKKKFLESI
jgi:hypothetical protein